MAQINVRIPKSLERDFEQHKNEFNVSEACQAAISRELDFRKALAHAIGDRDKTVARLKQERQHLQDEAFQAGRLATSKDFDSLSYTQIQTVLKACSEGWSAEVLIRSEGFEFLEKTFYQLELHDHQFDTYIRGWCHGICAIWEDIQNEVEAA
jgi:Arc/MetJ-type ribon-helix-helix transcriptional regulator